MNGFVRVENDGINRFSAIIMLLFSVAETGGLVNENNKAGRCTKKPIQ